MQRVLAEIDPGPPVDRPAPERPSPEPPTEEEIEQECRKIRETWTRKEKRKRAGALRPKPYTIPEVETPPDTYHWLQDHSDL